MQYSGMFACFFLSAQIFLKCRILLVFFKLSFLDPNSHCSFNLNSTFLTEVLFMLLRCVRDFSVPHCNTMGVYTVPAYLHTNSTVLLEQCSDNSVRIIRNTIIFIMPGLRTCRCAVA